MCRLFPLNPLGYLWVILDSLQCRHFLKTLLLSCYHFPLKTYRYLTVIFPENPPPNLPLPMSVTRTSAYVIPYIFNLRSEGQGREIKKFVYQQTQKRRKSASKTHLYAKRVNYQVEASTLKSGLFPRLYGHSFAILGAIPVNRGQNGALKLLDYIPIGNNTTQHAIAVIPDGTGTRNTRRQFYIIVHCLSVLKLYPRGRL